MSRNGEPLRARFEPLIRRAAHAWFLASRGLTLGVRGAVLDGAGKVLLVRHTYVAGWHMPGGGVEIGETAEEALARELREEGAVELTAPARLHGVFHGGRSAPRDHVLVYVVRQFRAEGQRAPDREIAEAAFFALDGLPEGTTRGTRDRLDEIASGRPPAATW